MESAPTSSGWHVCALKLERAPFCIVSTLRARMFCQYPVRIRMVWSCWYRSAQQFVACHIRIRLSLKNPNLDVPREASLPEGPPGSRPTKWRRCLVSTFSRTHVRIRSLTISFDNVRFFFFLYTDVKGVEFVINFDFPNNVEDYVHRIGRTGRAGCKGVSITLFTSGNSKNAKELVALMKDAEQVVPPELEEMARFSRGGGSSYGRYGGGGGFRGRGRGGGGNHQRW